MIWLVRLVSLAALAGFSAAVWFAGPLIGFADGRPLAPIGVRAAIVGTALALVAGYYGFRLWRIRRAADMLGSAIAKPDGGSDDEPALSARMQEAVALLARARGRRSALVTLPWYVVIGPPGAGKTTALVNSGLNFPLAGSGPAEPVAGVGGTRLCDWWFAEDAVLIDTAGRYTTQDSDATVDRKGWLAFLSLLKRHRPRQPLNGVIVAISLQDFMTLDQPALDRHVGAIRSRLREVREVLGLELPAYVVFTKADLVAGFMDYFGRLDEAQRRAVWGSTLEAGEAATASAKAVPAEFDRLAERLAAELPDRLEEEPDPAARIGVLGFPARFALLRGRVAAFLQGVFAPSGKEQTATFRGFYFTSGTQEGTPIDQVIGALGRQFGNRPTHSLSGKGKSFFLHDLLTKVIFPEAPFVTRDRAAERRASLLRGGAIAAMVLLAGAALGVLWLGFSANRALLAETSTALDGYRQAAAPLLSSTTVADADLENVIGPLELLRALPAGYDTRDRPAPLIETLGLGQRDRLASAGETAYREALERLLRSRLLVQLEETIAARLSDPAGLYEALKVYLMLGGMAPRTDDELVVAFMRQDWEANRYPGPQNRDGREALERHLRAMLALDDGYQPTFALNRQLVEAAQRSLGRMSVAERASALVASSSRAAALPDLRLADLAGPEAELVFETVDGSGLPSLTVPALYTRAGFDRLYLSELAGIADRLEADQWVVGAGGGQLGEEDLQTLGPALLDRYAKEFAAVWNARLDKLKLKPMTADKPEYLALSAAGAPASPIARLFEAVAGETALAREAEGEADEARLDGLARIGIVPPARKSQTRAGAAVAAPVGMVPGASIEAQFRPFQMLVDGPAGRRPIDALVQNFHDIGETMVRAAGAAQAERTNANLQLQIANLRANASRLPPTLSRMVNAAADDFEGDAAEASKAELNEALAGLADTCQQVVENRFPFAADAGDVEMVDFAQLFAPNGVFDRFFAERLAPLVDMSGASWQWRQDTRLGRELSPSALKSFQFAAEIRDAFFPMGGSVPSVNVTFTPFSLNGDADMALLDVNGQLVQSYQTGSSPGIVNWPGGLASGAAQLSLTPELPGRQSVVRFEGPWALKRLLDTATFSREGDTLQVRFVVGGRDVVYSVQVNGPENPFSLPALAGFSCPKGL